MQGLHGDRNTFKLHWNEMTAQEKRDTAKTAGAVRSGIEGVDEYRALLEARSYQIDLAIDC